MADRYTIYYYCVVVFFIPKGDGVMNYGLPYKGSKNSIAKAIIDALPAGDNFCDCCCGGGAILQAAVLSGKYKTVTGFDINKAIVGLVQAVMIDFGKIDYESIRLVTKEEFYARRDRQFRFQRHGVYVGRAPTEAQIPDATCNLRWQCRGTQGGTSGLHGVHHERPT